MMQIMVSYYQDGDNFVALINGGWWQGRGKTKDKARAAAFQHFNNEHERFTGKTYDFIEQGKPIQLELL